MIVDIIHFLLLLPVILKYQRRIYIINADTGYQIALIKNQKKAMETYNRLISVIQEKVNKYFIKPLEKIELRNSLDTIDLHMKLDEYKHKQI